MQRLARDHFDFAIDAVDDVESLLEHFAFVLGDGTVLTFGQRHFREGTDGFLDDVAGRGDHRPWRRR